MSEQFKPVKIGEVSADGKFTLVSRDDLSALPEDVRKAFRRMDRDAPCGYDVGDERQTIRAELLQRALLEKQLRDAYAKQHEALQGWVQRATDAEAELAALKARMKPCAQVVGGEVRALMNPDDEGKYVAVVVVEE